MSVFLTNDELALFAKNGFDGLAVKRTVDAYRAQGLSDDAIRGKIDDKLTSFYNDIYGADNVAKARDAVQETKESRPSNTLLDNMLTKEALAAGANGILVGTERALNGATLGVYDWANTQLGGGARQRVADYLADADAAGLGIPARAGIIAADIGGGVASPITKALGVVSKAIPSVSKYKTINDALSGGILGGAYGAARGAFDSDFNGRSTGAGALLGGGIGAVVPFASNAIKYTGNFAKNTIHAGRNAVDKVTRGALSPSAEDMAAGAQNISGALPDNGELTGTAVKNLADDITKAVKAKATALYDKAEQLAAGGKVVLDKNSNFAKAFDKLAGDATKSGRAELNKVWDEVGHNAYDAPTYETAKSFRSWLSEKSATGGTGLSKKQYGDLLEALDKDIEASLGKEASAAKKAADAFYRNEMGNPDSITNSVNKLLRNDPVSVVGNRAVASAQGRAWKASPLQKILQRGEEMGSPYVQDVKQGLQANTTTRAQFNRMSPTQKQMVYGDKLDAAEKNFNGGLLNWVENVTTKSVDALTNPTQKLFEALRPISAPASASVPNAATLLRALKNK